MNETIPQTIESAMPFEECYRAYFELIRNFAMSHVHDLDQAEDIAQQTFFKAFQAWSALKPQSYIKAWLIHIARNVLRDLFRSAHRRLSCSLDVVVAEMGEEEMRNAFSESDSADSLESFIELGEERDEKREAIRQTLKLLPIHYRVPLLLHDAYDCPHKEIACRLGIAESTCKTRVVRGRALFQQVYLSEQAPKNTKKGRPHHGE